MTDLRHFEHVARTKSFSAGARLSHVTTPAVSKAIRKLEDELQVKLFERTTRRVQVTEAGVELLSRCHRIFAELEGLQAALEASSQCVRGDLRIAAMEVFSAEVLPRVLTDLVREYPKVRPLCFEMPPARMEHLLLQGRIDVGFTIGGGTRDGIRYQELGRSPGVLVCGRGHALYGRKRIRQRDLHDHPSVAPSFLEENGTVGGPELGLDQFPMPREVGATIELLQMGVQLAIGGAFLGYFPEVSVMQPLADGSLWRLRGVRGARPFVLRALTRAGSVERPAVRELMQAMADAIR